MRKAGNTKQTARVSRGRRFAHAAILVVISGVFAFGLAEIALRLIPIPGITYHSFYYDDVTGGKHYPHTTYMYRNARGDAVNRRINAWGFPDVEHEIDPRPGTLRIGFFGDSYTQAIQVPIDQTFFRLTETELNARVRDFRDLRNRRGETVDRIEVLAFGISGRSTLQSYLECRQWMEKAQLDVVVYVYVENDTGDNLRVIKRATTGPYALLDGDSFVVDNQFAETYAYKDKPFHRTIQFLKANSLVVSTLEGRIKLLMRYGVKTRATDADFEGGEGVGGRAGMAPSSWPSDSLATTGWELTERITSRWRRDVEAQGRRFAIAAVPRGATLHVPLDEQDAWAPRLHAYCERTGIDLVDPLPLFNERDSAGDEIFYDHFTATGHRLFADVIVGYFVDLWEQS